MRSGHLKSQTLAAALLSVLLFASSAQGERVTVPFALKKGDAITLVVELYNESSLGAALGEAGHESFLVGPELARYEEHIEVIELFEAGYRIRLSMRTKASDEPLLPIFPGDFIVQVFRQDRTLAVDLDRWGNPVRIEGWREALEKDEARFFGDGGFYSPLAQEIRAEYAALRDLDDAAAAKNLLPVLSIWSVWHGANVDTEVPYMFDLAADPTYDRLVTTPALIEDSYLLFETRSEASMAYLRDRAEALAGGTLASDGLEQLAKHAALARTTRLEAAMDGSGVEFFEQTERDEIKGDWPTVRIEKLTILRRVD